jgi:hypothetical protein
MKIIFRSLSLAGGICFFVGQAAMGGEAGTINLKTCDQKDLRAQRECVRDQIEILTMEVENLTVAIESGEKREEPKEGILDPLAKGLDTLLTKPKNIGLKIFRSVEEEGRPAVFGWSQERGSEQAFLVDSAMRLSWPAIIKGALDDRLYMDLNLGFEAHASSASANRESNSLKWTVGTKGVFHPTGHLGTDPDQLGAPGISFLATTNFFSELNPTTRLANLGGEIVTSINYFPIAIGRYRQDPFKLIAFRWRPYLGLEGGGRVADGNGKQEEETAFGRLTARLRADLRLDFLSKRLIASGDYRYWNRFSASPHSLGIGTASLNYKISDHVYLGASYEEGRRPPSFGKVRRKGVELGIQY